MNGTIKISRNIEIERLRGVAVIMVIVTHGIFLHLFPVFMRRSFNGVDLFFAISGYVVTLSLLKLLPPSSTHISSFRDRLRQSSVAIKTFYIRRAFRIIPLAAAWLLIYFILSLMFYRPIGPNIFGNPQDVLKEIYAFFSGTYNYLVNYGLTGNVSHYWSLSVEEQFYLVLPILFVVFFTFKRRITAILGLLFILIFLIPFITGMSNIKILTLIFAQRYFTLFFGVLVALFTTKQQVIFKSQLFKKRLFLMAISVIVALLIFVLWSLSGLTSDKFAYNSGYIVAGMISTALVYLASFNKNLVLNFPFINKFLEFIGSRSYCIYLSHFAFIRLNIFVVNNPNLKIPELYKAGQFGQTIQSMMIFSVILITSQIFYKYLEQPSIKLGKKYIQKRYNLDVETLKISKFAVK